MTTEERVSGLNLSELESLSYNFVDNNCNLLIQKTKNEMKRIPLNDLYWGMTNTSPGDISRFNMFRGWNLGSAVTDEQWEEIRNGTFRDMFIGDFWLIGGIRWSIADFQYFLGSGDNDTKIKENHVVIIPQSGIGYERNKMNETDTTNGGYIGSYMHKDGLNNARAIIKAAFGDEHILTVRRLFSDAVVDGVVTGITWTDSQIDLPTVGMFLGYAPRCLSYAINGDVVQLKLFQKQIHRIFQQYNACWTCDPANDTQFHTVSGTGAHINHINASYDYMGVRPVFAIKG